jgi:signal transduction histidine kinase
VELIAHAHGGTASVASRPGGGGDAWISLPAAKAAAPALTGNL